VYVCVCVCVCGNVCERSVFMCMCVCVSGITPPQIADTSSFNVCGFEVR
jgi:hypothetical protein